MNTYYHFSLDKTGKVDTVSHNSKKNKEELQHWLSQLVEEKLIILGERIEGFIRIVGYELYIDYRQYQDVKNNVFTEHQKFLKYL